MHNPLPNYIIHVVEREKGKQGEQETPELDQLGESAGFTSSQFLHVTAVAQTTSMMDNITHTSPTRTCISIETISHVVEVAATNAQVAITAQQKKLPSIESYKHQHN